MNQKTAKLLRKYAVRRGIPIRFAKRVYLRGDTNLRAKDKQELEMYLAGHKT